MIDMLRIDQIQCKVSKKVANNVVYILKHHTLIYLTSFVMPGK